MKLSFFILGFVAWFPTHSIFVALPFFAESTEKYGFSLIAFPICIFLPSIFSDYSMLSAWPKVRLSFNSKVKCALSCQLLTSIIFTAVAEATRGQYKLEFWLASLAMLLILGFCRALLLTNMQSVASVLPEEYTAALMIGGSFCMIFAVI